MDLYVILTRDDNNHVDVDDVDDFLLITDEDHDLPMVDGGKG